MTTTRKQQLATLLIAVCLFTAVLWLLQYTDLGVVVAATIFTACVIGAIGSEK